MSEWKPSSLKLEARRLLAGKYSMIAPVLLVMAACSMVLEYVISSAFPALSGIFNLILYLACNILVNIILTVLRGGLYMIYRKLQQGQDWRTGELFASFSNHPETLGAYGLISFLFSFGTMFAVSVLFWYSPFSLGITLGIMAALLIAMCWFSLTYKASLYLYAWNPERKPLQLMRDSRILMQRYRLKLLWLKLTFVGVLLLGALAFGFGLLFALPYLEVTEILFFQKVMERKGMEMA